MNKSTTAKYKKIKRFERTQSLLRIRIGKYIFNFGIILSESNKFNDFVRWIKK